ncbi:MAG: tail fiber domain-containing protein [Candidatus Zixiibacteriota bacterium]
MRYPRIFILCGLLLLGLAFISSAAIPPFINYQGRLTDSSGDPVSDGIYSVVFTLYNAPTDGTAKWISDPTSVDVKDGLFSTLIGVIPSSVFDPPSDLFLGITVGADPEIAPRSYVVAVPFAYYATSAYSSTTCPAWSINGDHIYRSTGNVGLGVSNPQERLTLGNNLGDFLGECIEVGSNEMGLARLVLGEDDQHFVNLLWADNGDAFAIFQRSAENTYTVLYAVAGNVGIGESSPDFRLHVLSSGEGDGMRVDNHIGTQLFRVRENSDGSSEVQVSDNTGGVKAMIRSNGDSYFNGGDVGIGTTSPNYTLDVRGTIGNNTTLYHSDKRWKEDIRNLQGSLDKVMNLQGVQYRWRQNEYPEMNFPDGNQIGLIAQDVEKIIPEVVNKSEDGYKSIDYAKLVSVLIESIKEQQGQIETLSKRIDELEGIKISSK